MKVPIEKIKVKKRLRKDVGNLYDLKESLKKYGLLHPIVVDENMTLVSGMRRLLAAKELGWKEIEVKVIPIKNKREKLYLEVEENIRRKDFTEEELKEIKRLLESKWYHRLWWWLRDFWIGIKNFFLNLFRKSS